MAGLKAILTANTRVASILDCKAPKKISQQLQFDGVLGLYQNDIIASVEASAAPFIKVSNFHFSSNRCSESNIITTSAACRMTITHHEGVQIPTTFTVPSWAGLDKTITYKRLFQYGTNQKSDTPSDQPKKSATPPSASSFKTIMCRQFKQGIDCPYNLKCQFAHGEKELRKNQPGNNPTSDGMHEQAPTPPSPKPTTPTPKPTIPTSSPAPTPPGHKHEQTTSNQATTQLTKEPPSMLTIITPTTPLAQTGTHLTGQLGNSPLSPTAASQEASINVVPGFEEDLFSLYPWRKGKGISPHRFSTMDLSRPTPSEFFSSKSPVNRIEKLVEHQSRLPFGNQDEVSLKDIPLYPNIVSTSQ